MNMLISLVVSFIIYFVSNAYINDFSVLSYMAGGICAVVVGSIINANK